MTTNKQPQANDPHEAVRTGVSLLLFIHLFCVGVGLCSSFSFSQLQGKLVSLFFPYTRAFHLEPNYLPIDRRVAGLPPVAFHLTAGEGETRMHQWLLTTATGNTFRYPDRGWPFQHRMDRLARVAGYFGKRLESDEVPAEIVKAMCGHLLSELSSEERNGPIYVRCLRHIGNTDPLILQPHARDVEVLYEADVWFGGGEDPLRINVLKRAPRSQSAPPVGAIPPVVSEKT